MVKWKCIGRVKSDMQVDHNTSTYMPSPEIDGYLCANSGNKSYRLQPSTTPRSQRTPDWTSQVSSPKIERASGREGGADLCHGDADEPGEEGDYDPAPDEGRRPRVLQAGPVQRRDPREERHRREGDGQRLEQRLHQRHTRDGSHHRPSLSSREESGVKERGIHKVSLYYLITPQRESG